MIDPNKVRIAELLLKRFRGNPSVVALEKGGAPPQPMPLSRPIKAEELAERHLAGGPTIGVYLIDPQTDSCWCSCLDFDDHRPDADGEQAIADARTCAAFLADNAMEPLIEISQSGKGAHVWLLHSHPILAKTIRQFWRGVLKAVQCKAEIYPKQDSLQGLDKGLGNFVRMPLSGASHFENIAGETLDPLQALTVTTCVSPYLIQSKNEAWHVSETVVDVRAFETEGLPTRVQELLNDDPSSNLARRWASDTNGMMDDSRSALVQGIATELVRHYVPTPEVEAAIQWWCERQNYEKPESWHNRVLCNAYGFATKLKEKESIRAGTFCGLVHKALDRAKAPTLIPSGIAALDSAIGGIGLGELGFLAARPGACKTALMLEWLDAAAACGFPGMFFSLEMGAAPVFGRVLSRLGVNPERNSGVDLGEAHRIVDRYYASRAPMYFIESVPQLKDIREMVSEYVREKGIKFVCLDHLACIQTSGKDDFQRLNTVIDDLREMKKEMDIAILVAAHLGRAYEQDGGGRPTMQHLRGTGNIEVNADLILGGRWLALEDVDDPFARNRYVVHCLKSRNRETKNYDVECRFDADSQRFE